MKTSLQAFKLSKVEYCALDSTTTTFKTKSKLIFKIYIIAIQDKSVEVSRKKKGKRSKTHTYTNLMDGHKLMVQ